MTRAFVCCAVFLAVTGCQTNAPRPSASASTTKAVVPNVESPGGGARRKRTPRQMEVLRQFALAEAPNLWQTVQELKVEQTQRRAGLQRLDQELRDFGRLPETDLDFQTLVREADELDRVVDAILLKVEDAYLAQQKFRAMPSRGDYEVLMKSALENGVRAADGAARRFHKMARKK